MHLPALEVVALIGHAAVVDVMVWLAEAPVLRVGFEVAAHVLMDK